MLIYSPANGGFNSGERTYHGFTPTEKNQSEYQLRPAEPMLLELNAQDLVSICNTEGATSIWLLPFQAGAHTSLAALGITVDTNISVTGIQDASGIDTASVYAISRWLDAQGASAVADACLNDPSNLKGYRVFDSASAAGELFTIAIKEAVSLWILIENSNNTLSKGGAGGHLQVSVRSATASDNDQTLPLPLPGSSIRDEFTVSRASAHAYRVKAGEYIQIIDVEGRQCSDFMAVRSDALDRGEEQFIDSTVTRSMTGGAYPGPGLFDKFFDQNMKPLMRVVQDTVGRHDTFALACTARGYEERGFFGHINCSDNISSVYDPYGITPRRAWPAINFFFNSWILPSDNRIQSDEAWSQPGDFVTMQAMTDLICVSTACPDDVDPINGWNPTDIHVRIYNESSPVKHAVAYRATPESEALLTEHSAFHARTSELTENYTVARDTWMPANYESSRALGEYHACRNGVTIQDMSSLRKFDILGPDAEALLQLAMTRNISKLALNRGVYALLCDDSGTVIDDGTLFRLTPDAFRWCCGSDDSSHQLKKLCEQHRLNVWIKSLFRSMPNLAIQGPSSRELLARITFTQPHQPSLETMKWFGSTIARLHDRNGTPFQLTRTGYTGELGYEIFCENSSALPIWDALMEHGEDLSLTPMGNDALDIIRIEAGLMAAGHEFGPDADAFESGLGFAVDLSKEDFVGREALQRNSSQGAQRRKLVGLKFSGNEVPIHGDGVFIDRRQIGVVTSATRSPTLECAIAMARLNTEHSQPGQAIEVGKLDGYKKRLNATVCEIPFVDPDRTRARS